MNQDIKTIELAKVYESQGYFQEALDIYTFLCDQETSNSLQAAIERMEKKIQGNEPVADHQTKVVADEKKSAPDESRISWLIEKWLMIMILKQRLATFKKIKARL